MLEGLWEWVAGAEATMAATEASPVGNDMETVETQLAQHEVCILFYCNIGHCSLPYSICRIPLAFLKQTPMNIPTIKMFSLCICEVFVKVHITNKVILQNRIWACLYLLLSVCTHYTYVITYIHVLFLIVKWFVYLSKAHCLSSTKFFQSLCSYFDELLLFPRPSKRRWPLTNPTWMLSTR